MAYIYIRTGLKESVTKQCTDEHSVILLFGHFAYIIAQYNAMDSSIMRNEGLTKYKYLLI